VSEDAKELLTIRDLAARWGVSVDRAKRNVRGRGVPFFRIGSDADMRINWNTVRFRLPAVLKWEQESEEVFEPAEAEPAEARAAATAGKYRFTRM
jgi:hypothetical protein